MPELPEVETFRRHIEAHALGRTIAEITLEAPRLLEGIDEATLRKTLLGHRLQTTHRHGKYLFTRLDHGPWLVLHFGMSGEPRAYGPQDPPPPYARLILHFQDGGHLAYIDPRKLGEISLTPDPDRFIHGKGLGPDALAIDWPTFHHLTQGQRGMIKPWLMDQHHIAGIGNVYSDEILFQTGIHPRHPLPRLGEGDRHRLHHHLHDTLEQAIAAHADPTRLPPHFLIPQRHPGGRCPRCHTVLEHSKINGRTSWYCPRCQPEASPTQPP